MQEAKTYIDSFEKGAIQAEAFNHRAHIKLAWSYIQVQPLHQAIGSVSGGLKTFAAKVGQPQKYHETITWAFMLLVHERHRQNPADDWAGFAAKNQDLFQSNALQQLYHQQTLANPAAKQTFHLPDRLANEFRF